MSWGVTPISSVVTYRPPSDSTQRPKARIMAWLFSVRESAHTTALPPPRSSPAAAFL